MAAVFSPTSPLWTGPLVAIVAGALVVMLLEAFLKPKHRERTGIAAVIFLLASAAFSVRAWGLDASFFGGLLVFDRLALVLTLALAAAGTLIVLMSLNYAAKQDIRHGESNSLLLMAIAGGVIMVSSPSLLVIFLGLETLSVSSYAMAGLKREDGKSTEAAVKYFLTGSFASAFLVFGLALLYGASGSLDIRELATSGTAFGPAMKAGLALVVAGFGFKIALVPFHMWAPDVYEGAPTPITAFFAVGPKIAGFAVVYRLLSPPGTDSGSRPAVLFALSAIAVLTMVLANLAAVRQKNLKRLLAYSSIAHSGYILLAVLARDVSSLAFYLVVYLLMTVGAFASLAAMTKGRTEYQDIEDFAGIGTRYPWLAGFFSVFLFSLAGFPPTAGFLAKFYVFAAAVRQGHTALVVVAVLASLVSVYYYLKIVVVMYMRDPRDAVIIDTKNPALYLVMVLCLYGVIQLGIWPGNLLVLIRQAASSLF